jgi:hypothetical protein
VLERRQVAAEQAISLDAGIVGEVAKGSGRFWDRSGRPAVCADFSRILRSRARTAGEAAHTSEWALADDVAKFFTELQRARLQLHLESFRKVLGGAPLFPDRDR